MGVARHLGIKLNEYDSRIRTFIPDYEEMLQVAADEVPAQARDILDLGTGTGALAQRCLKAAPQARAFGIDADSEILKLAEGRLRSRARLLCGNFTRTALPTCDVVVASLALHHIRTHTGKTNLYRRVRRALRPEGVFIIVDCHPASDERLARKQHAAWKSHLRCSYSEKEARALLASWAREDTYVPLETELGLLRQTGFTAEVLWRKGLFAVLLARR